MVRRRLLRNGKRQTKTEPMQVRERTFETDDDLVNETEEERLPERAFPVSEKTIAGVMCAMVIADQSISRRHVRFSREGNKICMTDLNSTNGTFKNGLRLDPNTSEILEPGDEIRLGKLKFIYR